MAALVAATHDYAAETLLTKEPLNKSPWLQIGPLKRLTSFRLLWTYSEVP